MKKNNDSKLSKALPWIMGIVAFMAYFATRSHDVAAGISAQTLGMVFDLQYIPATTHFLYILFARIACIVLPGSALFKLILLSVVFGALCVVVFFKLMMFSPLYEPRGQDAPLPFQKSCQTFGAVLGSLLLILVLPLWQVSSIPYYLNFDVFLLLLCFYLVFRYWKENGSRGILLVAVFLYGIGITEYAVMIGLSPIFMFFLLFALLQRGELTYKILLPLLGLGILGLLFYLVPVWVMAKTNNYGYGEFDGFWNTLLDLWKKQFRELKSALPSLGGLLIILITLFPWGYAFFIPKPLRFNRTLGSAITTITLVFLSLFALSLLLEIRFSPIQIIGLSPSITLCYMFIASWAGYLGGFWLLRVKLADRKIKFPATIFWRLLIVILFLTPIGMWSINFSRIMTSRMPELSHYARDVVASTDKDTVLFTPRLPINELLLFIAHTNEHPKIIIDTTMLSSPSYQLYLAATFQDAVPTQTSRLDNVILVKSILSNDKLELSSHAFIHPDMILSLGYQPVPNGLVSTPTTNILDINALNLFTRNIQLLEGPFADSIHYLNTFPNSHSSSILLTEYSRFANNLGVTLRMLKDDDLAEKAFRFAHAILSNNPCALLNLRGLYLDQAKRFDTDEFMAQSFRDKAKACLNNAFMISRQLSPDQRNLFYLNSHYGTVFSENTSLILAHNSHNAGQSDFTASTIEQARLINSDSLAVQAGSALFNLGAGNVDEAEIEYRALLQANPSNITALIGYAASAYYRGDINESIKRLNISSSLRCNPAISGFLAMLYSENNDLINGLHYYNVATSATNLGNITAAFLATAAYRLAKWDDAEKFAKLTIKIAPNNKTALTILANLAVQKGDTRQIQKRFEELQRAAPKDIFTLEKLISIYMQQNMQARARAIAEDLLTLDSNNTVANQLLALFSNDLAVQEYYLRRATLNTNHPLYPYVLNNLAFALAQQNKFEEAHPLAIDAIDILSNDASFHHTLATILFGMKQYAEAENQIIIARTLDPNDSIILLLHGEIMFSMGRKTEARSMISHILQNLDGKYRDRALQLLQHHDVENE